MLVLPAKSKPALVGVLSFAMLLLAMPSATAQVASVQFQDIVCVVPPDKRPESGGENLRFELVELHNALNSTVDMGGWTLRNALREDRPVPDVYEFPEGFTLAPDAVVTVHVGEGDDNATDLFMDRETQFFANDLLDGAVLSDETGEFVHSNDCESFSFGCPEVIVRATDDGSVELTFEFVDESDPLRWRVYRADEPGPGRFNEVAVLSGKVDTLVDGTAPKGQEVRYIVVAEFEHSRGQDCPEHSVTTIPYFPGGAIAGLAALGAVGVLVGLRRRG